MSFPPGLKAPVIWQMLSWIVQPFTLMERCAQRYGDCFSLALSTKFPPMVLVSAPEALQHLLSSDNGKDFDVPGELNEIFEPLLGSQSVLGLGGEPHRRMRQLMMPPFHGERMRSYSQLMGEITQTVIGTWSVGQNIDVHAAMQSISMRVILSAVFGVEVGSRYQRLEQLLAKMLNDMGSSLGASMLYFRSLRQDWGSWSPWGNFLRTREQIDQIIYAEIADRRAHPNPERQDILTLLMSAQDETGAGLTDEELRDELMTLLVAGHETTATALTWAMYWLHKLPDVRTHLRSELQNLEDLEDVNALLRLPYLNAVCSETLRIHPVGILTFPRVVRTPVAIAGHTLDPGTIILGCIYLAHRCESVYPQPEQFRPERFLERQFSPYEYLPFGGGARRCIGMAFAQFEMKVVLAHILSEVELSLANSKPARPIRRGLTAGASPVHLRVEGFIPVIPRPRTVTSARLHSP
ncbi:cytochrome P450 [Synechococcales cyanobacterium C]|uniref:Cytochrome P450 n=1 Tax=Petrachloros mirabilis ULC683 TaxID=2781853 RepID=A0A8K1ZZ12_9CYAN|nr:cytochrome P450 [Petrachloros mirabilis]NCJ06747.1 cytochrome P450 [Petrachloros mirabilis ULC683]